MRMHGDGRKAKNPKQTFMRLLGYLKPYTPRIIIMVLCIIMATVASVMSNASLETLIEDLIKPMLVPGAKADFGPLIRFLIFMGCIYLAGMVATFLANFLMVPVGQGIQRRIRNTMFTHMQRLPIRYFDTHQVGDVMSRYTSDIDTLRQMITQAIPQCITSAITIVVVFFTMLFTSPILTAIVIVSVVCIFFITAKVAKSSAQFFIGQQRSLGAVNGYVEEMVGGQRVVKVFTREEICKEEFDKLNENLRKNAFKAGAFTNMMGPVNNNLSYIQYSILAVVGAILVINTNLLTTGALVSFLLLSRTFNQPIGQVSNQINAIIMALAGAERIF